MSINFNTQPYYDDFETPGGAKDKNYMRILFRPGKAVQARELTQLQSILQNQISKFGNHIFQDGSPVFGGHVSLDNDVISLTLEQQYANVDINLSDFLPNGNSTLITNTSGEVNVKAQVIAIDDTQTNPIILVKYLTGNRFADGDNIQVAVGVQTSATLVSSNSSTGASVCSINDGVFFSKGYFVQVNPQTIVLDSANTEPSFRIGLEISESIVDEVSDSNLLDPAQNSFNYQAPGANRYQYNLNLSKRTLDSVDDSAFYELLRVENGIITKQVNYPIYSEIDKTFARRTYDQSGDFTVNPFVITIQDNPANTSQYTTVVEPGKAYVKGFEFETIGIQKLYGDKARSTNTVTDYATSLEYGNLLTVTNVYGGNVSGFFDVTNFQSVDLHTVPTANVNTANAALYNSTKIGTARVRNIEYLGLNNYYAYLVDINTAPNTCTAAAGSNNTITLPANYSAYNNAYANVSVVVRTLTSGGYVYDTRTCNNYVGSTRVMSFARNLTTVANATSFVSLNFATKDIDSIVIAPTTFATNVYVPQNASSGLYASMDISPFGVDIENKTIISDTQFNKMIYPLSQSYVAQNTITNASFTHRKNLWSQTFTSGNLVLSSGSGLSTGESVALGVTNGYLTDTTANANFMIIVRNAMSSNLSNGTIINFNRNTVPGGNGVYQQDSTHLTLVVGANNTFIADVLATVQITNASSATVTRRTKTLMGNSSNSTLVSTDNYLNGTAVIGTTNANSVYLDTANGHVWFISNNDNVKTPGAKQSLYVPDVFGITAIYDSGDPSFKPNVSNAIDITNNYYLDSGQRDNYYDHAAIILKAGVSPPKGQTVVMIQAYSHDSVTGFFDADSYSTTAYNIEAIPYYNSPAFGTFSLRDSIDFRPTRTIGTTANVQSFVLSGLRLPQPDHSMTLTYEFYLPRIDKLLLSKDKTFKIKQGIPSLYPTAPTDSDDSMTLYVLNIPAFTSDVSKIKVEYIENKRYTMRDIGTLDKRIQQLEYYSTLSQLESQAVNEKILYQDNITAKDQYGIIADDFGSFSIADNKNSDLTCYLQQGTMSPYKIQSPMRFHLVSSSNTFDSSGKTIGLGFSEQPIIVQNTATKYISIQPYLFGQFKGTVKLTPQTDYWYSQNLTPSVITPPGAKTIELPPAPPPPAAITLANSAVANTKTTPVIVGQSNDPQVLFRYNGYAYGSILNSVYIENSYPYTQFSYGVLSPTNNWFGVPASIKPSVNGSSVAITNLGSSIQLDSIKNIGVGKTLSSVKVL